VAGKRRLAGSLLPLILALNEWRCSYRFDRCLTDKGLVLTFKVPPSLGGNAALAANYALACRSCSRRLNPIMRTNQIAA